MWVKSSKKKFFSLARPQGRLCFRSFPEPQAYFEVTKLRKGVRGKLCQRSGQRQQCQCTVVKEPFPSAQGGTRFRLAHVSACMSPLVESENQTGEELEEQRVVCRIWGDTEVFIISPNALQMCDLETMATGPTTGEDLEVQSSHRSGVLPVGRERPIHSQRGGSCNGNWPWEEAKSSWTQ